MRNSVSSSPSSQLLQYSSRFFKLDMVGSYYSGRRITPNAIDSNGKILNQCKPNLALIERTSAKSCGFSLARFSPNLLHPSPFSASRRFFTVSPSFPELVVAFVAVIPAFGVFLHFRYTRTVPYTHRKRYMNFSESVSRKMEEEFLEEIIREKSKGKILPATHPQSVKVCSIVKNLLDVLHRDLGLLQVPIITYYNHTDVIKPIRKSFFDMSFRQVRSRINGWRTDIKHLKGLNWLVVVIVAPRYTAFSLGGGIIAVSTGFLNANCDLGITTVLAHEVGHCVARHSTEIIDFNSTTSPLHTYGRQSIAVNMRRRVEIEADYIGLVLMALSGFDPFVILHFYEKTEARYRHAEHPDSAIFMKERVRILSNPHVMEKAFNIYRQTKSSDLKANPDIRQHVDIVSENQKYSKLVKILEDIMDGSHILIFMDTNKGCDQITRQLRVDGWPALSIHSDKSQAERDLVFSEFEAGKSPIMTTTDVAACGLDVKYVINYDFPGSLEDYVRRISITGRGGAKGTAYTFFTASNARFAKVLVSILEEAGQKVSPELAAMGRGAPPPPSGFGGF